MVDYTYHGDGSVTVTPSKGQTGGSGFSSSGTYASDQAARSAVSSGTTEGALPGTTKKEQEVSKEWEPGWGGRREDKEVWQPGYGGRRQESQAAAITAASKTPILTARLQGNTGYDPYANIQGITREEYLASQRAPDQSAGIRRAAPITAGVYERSAELSAGLQKGFEGMIGYSPSAHPVVKFAAGAGSALTGLPAFFGSGAVGFEAASRMAVTKPAKIPEVFAKGLIGFGGGLVEQAKQRPIETAGMVAALITGPKLIKSGSGKIGEMVKFRGKTFVPAETIIEPQVLSGAERFPLAPIGTTGAQLVTEFKTSKFKLPGTETKTGGWHATPEEFARQTVTQIGTSEGKGMYISPSTSPHFWKIGKDYKLFGFDTAPETPTGIWLETEDITRSPVNTRFNIESQNKFLTETAPKGKGFISSAFELGMKPEKEAIIPPETPISRVRFEQFTKWMGKKVPLMEYTVKTPEPLNIITGGGQTSDLFLPNTGKVFVNEPVFNIKTGGMANLNEMLFGGSLPKKSIVLGGTAIALSGSPASSKQETYGDMAAKQLKIANEYKAYKEPIITQSALALPAGLSSKQVSSISTLKSSPIVKLPSSEKTDSYSSKMPKPVMSELVRSIQSNQRSVRSGVSRVASTSRYPSTTSMMSQSYVKPLQSVVRHQASPRQAYPSSSMSMIGIPQKLKLEMPKSKLTMNFKKSLKASSYGKFPERARAASAGRVLGMKGLKFPWEEEKKKAVRKASGKKAATASKSRKASRKSSSTKKRTAKRRAKK
jgi:hypothetical protein